MLIFQLQRKQIISYEFQQNVNKILPQPAIAVIPRFLFNFLTLFGFLCLIMRVFGTKNNLHSQIGKPF